MSFSQSISHWAEGATEEMAELNKAIVLSLFNSVIRDTPVLEGRLRGNWQISSNKPKTGTVEVKDPVGNITLQEVSSFVRGIDGAKDIDLYLTNNLPYAYFIEYGGSREKAPEGMVRKNMIRIVQILAART